MDPDDLGRPGGWHRLARRPVLAILAALGVVILLGLLLEPGPLDALAAALVALAGLAAVLERQDVAALEGGRRTEAESFARILRGLARSISPDAIVAAIVEEVGAATGADHVAVVRRQPDAETLEATLVATRPGSIASRTILPLGDLQDPARSDPHVAVAVTTMDGHRLAAVPIVPDPAREQELVPTGPAPGGSGPRTDAIATMSSTPAGSLTVRVPAARPVPDPGGARVASLSLRRRGGSARWSAVRPPEEPADQRIADRIARRVREAYGVSHTIAAPLRIDGRVEGAIVLSRRTGTPWPGPTRRILAAAAVEASAALARIYSLRAAEARATTDALTGLPNRRYFDEYLLLLSRRRRADDRIGVLMIDIDRFKKLNDTFGHAVGDHVLRDVARAIAGAVREDDIPARIGGEEFAVLLRNPTRQVAIEVAERVRLAVGALDLRALGVPWISVSIGVAVAARPDESPHDLVGQADRALYRAKRGGRDRVVA